VKPSPFTYHRPSTLDEALETLAALGEQGKVLAGGQSLVPLMSMRLAAPAHLVDINHLPGLDVVEVSAGEVRIGALVRHAALEGHVAAYAAIPLLRQALLNVAHPTIRNRGTTVGSIVHADPAAEMPAVLVLLDGTMELASTSGSREVPAQEFFVGPMQSATRADELAVAARFRRPGAGSGSAFVELARRHGDYAMCGVAALVTTDAEAAITSARVALISVGDGPVLVDVTGAVRGSGGGFDRGRLEELVDVPIEPEGDIHASADYRRQLAHVLTARALDEAHGRAVHERRRRSAA
jgi:aerobic carbon-monoxide dehydrogenase medium subunit